MLEVHLALRLEPLLIQELPIHGADVDIIDVTPTIGQLATVAVLSPEAEVEANLRAATTTETTGEVAAAVKAVPEAQPGAPSSVVFCSAQHVGAGLVGGSLCVGLGLVVVLIQDVKNTTGLEEDVSVMRLLEDGDCDHGHGHLDDGQWEKGGGGSTAVIAVAGGTVGHLEAGLRRGERQTRALRGLWNGDAVADGAARAATCHGGGFTWDRHLQATKVYERG